MRRLRGELCTFSGEPWGSYFGQGICSYFNFSSCHREEKWTCMNQFKIKKTTIMCSNALKGEFTILEGSKGSPSRPLGRKMELRWPQGLVSVLESGGSCGAALESPYWGVKSGGKASQYFPDFVMLQRLSGSFSRGIFRLRPFHFFLFLSLFSLQFCLLAVLLVCFLKHPDEIQQRSYNCRPFLSMRASRRPNSSYTK